MSGVCGGIAEYLNIDPTIVRLLWAIAAFMFGSGILAYIVCATDETIQLVSRQQKRPPVEQTDGRFLSRKHYAAV